MSKSKHQKHLKPAYDLHQSLAHRTGKPHSVMVFPILGQGVVWVRHPARGWEVPGGKLELGETAEQAICREAFEEAGVSLDNLQWIAEYRFTAGVEARTKWVYTAKVTRIQNRPLDSEIADVVIFDPALTPELAAVREDVSLIMKDDVFSLVWPTVRALITPGSVDV